MFLINHHGSCGSVRRLARNALEHDDDVCQFLVGTDQVEAGHGHLLVELAANGVLFERGDWLLGGRRAVQGDGTGDVTSGDLGGDGQAKAKTRADSSFIFGFCKM